MRDHGHSSPRTIRHALSLVQMVALVVQLVVFGVGTAAVDRRATAEGPRVTANPGAPSAQGSSATPDDPRRIERAAAARTRRDRGERGTGGPHLAPFLASTSIVIAPAARAEISPLSRATRTWRDRPSLVNGPRGPPAAC